MKKKGNILITGAGGGLASELSKALCDDYNLIGIDPRSENTEHKFLGDIYKSNYVSRKVDELFRRYKFEAFFHLGRIPVTSTLRRSERYSVNVLGTKHLLDLCADHNLPTVVVMSSFYVYGAHPHNPLYLKENDPLRATQRIPELSDALEMDHLATQFSLTFKGQTIVLRPTHIVGSNISNAVSKLLRLPWMPVPLGFDPPIQLLHQSDLVRALVEILKKPQKGIYNLAAPGSAALSNILELKNIKKVPIPDILIRSVLNRIPFPLVRFPSYMVDFFKFPTLIDTSAFSKTYNFKYEYGLIESLANI